MDQKIDSTLQNKTEILNQKAFEKFLSFASISSEKTYQKQMHQCVHWLEDIIRSLNFSVELWQEKDQNSHPILFAQSPMIKGAKTLLIYNHYDVQPVDPIEEWSSNPFKATEKEENIFARGASDNKGQCFYVLKALQAIYQKHKGYPINIKLCIEGEEEVGSPFLSNLLKGNVLPEKKPLLEADYLAIVDLGIPAMDTPAITLGTRGIMTMSLTLEGSNGDLHSGSHGGIVYNPLHGMVEMLSKLRDCNGKILVPGFYDHIPLLSEEQKKEILFSFDEKSYFNHFQAEASGGEKEFSPNERAWIRPTLEINGLWGGYNGEGFKTVIPQKAQAKISARLVPGQKPQTIQEKVINYLKQHVPQGLRLSYQLHQGYGSAVRSNSQSTVVQAFKSAYENVFEKPCQFLYEGGSIPIIPEMQQATDSEVVMIGLALPTDQIHAPNEHFSWQRIEMGASLIEEAIFNLAKIDKNQR